jgi:A/G-specific adenine glycosylase
VETRKIKALVDALLPWYAVNARDLPWRRTKDPYAIHVSEIMLQQTQVKTVIPFWERWLRELPTIAAAADASPDKLHKLWEGLGYYTRVRNLQKAAQVIVREHGGEFPERFEDVLALPGIGRYTAGAICSIAFNQPVPILDGNVIRVLTRIFGIGANPKAKATNQRLWKLAEALVSSAARGAAATDACSRLNQSLMELGALVCTPRQPQCPLCPARRCCVAFREGRVGELPNLGERTRTTARHFTAFVIARAGKFLVRQRPAGVVNAHLWEFPNVETNGRRVPAEALFQAEFGAAPRSLVPLATVKHSITRYRITLEAFTVDVARAKLSTRGAVWKTPAQMHQLAFTSAHRRILRAATGGV